jgi:integrase/recombinase XerC/integrase/recombinase XerD
MGKLVRLPSGGPPSLAGAVAAFLADRDLAATTRRAYRVAYQALLEHFDPQLPVTELSAEALRQLLTHRWGKARPRTYNARLAAVQSFVGYCRRQGWLAADPTAALERHRVPRHESRAIRYEDLDAIWSRGDIALREKLLWRCLYATAARATEVLGLNVEDLDLGRKRAVITGKGGHRQTIIWDAGTARLFPRYLAGRKRGPVFVTKGRPNVQPADLDRSPDGRARLSYQRAWAIFHAASGGRWTLHQLRHSALTHLGEQGVATPLLMAKSRHRDLRTLSRYVQPGVEAVARLTAEHDPARRTRPRSDK